MCVGQGMVRLTKWQRKEYRQQYYTANKNEALDQKKANYKLNADGRKETDKLRYRVNFDEKILLQKIGMPLIQDLREEP